MRAEVVLERHPVIEWIERDAVARRWRCQRRMTLAARQFSGETPYSGASCSARSAISAATAAAARTADPRSPGIAPRRGSRGRATPTQAAARRPAATRAGTAPGKPTARAADSSSASTNGTTSQASTSVGLHAARRSPRRRSIRQIRPTATSSTTPRSAPAAHCRSRVEVRLQPGRGERLETCLAVVTLGGGTQNSCPDPRLEASTASGTQHAAITATARANGSPALAGTRAARRAARGSRATASSPAYTAATVNTAYAIHAPSGAVALERRSRAPGTTPRSAPPSTRSRARSVPSRRAAG